MHNISYSDVFFKKSLLLIGSPVFKCQSYENTSKKSFLAQSYVFSLIYYKLKFKPETVFNCYNRKKVTTLITLPLHVSMCLLIWFINKQMLLFCGTFQASYTQLYHQQPVQKKHLCTSSWLLVPEYLVSEYLI